MAKVLDANKKSFSVVDVLKIVADEKKSESAVNQFDLSDTVETIDCDVFIAGGSTAGVAAALAATAKGDLKVCVCEQTDWLGGQMTCQGVPVTDDGRNFQVETSGANRSYQRFRNAIRDHYKQTYKISPAAAEQKFFNPGNCWYWVSQLTFEPKVAVQAIDKLLDNSSRKNKPSVYLRHTPVMVECSGRQIDRVLTVNLDTGKWLAFKAESYIDATELGDLLGLAGAAYSSGTEARSETGEPGAPEKADVEQVQDYTFPFIVELIPGTNNTIPKPPLYDRFNGQGKYSLLRYKMFGHGNKLNRDGVIISELMPFWTYRRLLDKTNFVDERIANDVAVINWVSNDFRGHNLIDKEPSVVARYLSLAKLCSLGFLYWLQTEAPRDDGGKGYPELKLKVDAMGTSDGLSKHPYIRESRRGKTFTIIKEQDIKSDLGATARARLFDDSVGIGFFPIDIHGRDAAPTALGPTKHFQIPLGALLLDFPSNLILSSKNIGTTHITNGAYRLHPIEWAIGEAAGALACFAIQQKVRLHEVLNTPKLLRLFQKRLIRSGVPLYWYDDVPTIHPCFEAIQSLAVCDVMRGDPRHLHFEPDAPLSEGEIAQILKAVAGRFKGLENKLQPAESSINRGIFATWLYGQIKEIMFEQASQTMASPSKSRV
jgi:hypothetical protein